MLLSNRMSEIDEKQSLWDINKFAGIDIRMRKADGFLSATDMIRTRTNLKLNNYLRNDKTKEYLKELSNETGYPILQLVEIKKGGISNQQGTWIHPYVATNLAQWISPLSSARVSKWVIEWSSISKENEQEFHKALSELEPSKSSMLEKGIQDKLKITLNAQVEVETPVGRIDLVTIDRIIEIKEVSKWKHAIGQILSYGTFYPDKHKAIYLFGGTLENEHIKKICDQYDIELIYDNNEEDEEDEESEDGD